MPILLEGGRLSGEAAVKAHLAEAVANPGEEIAVAEEWLLPAPSPLQPWGREDWISAAPADVSAALAPAKRTMLKTSLGHYPAPVLAVLSDAKADAGALAAAGFASPAGADFVRERARPGYWIEGDDARAAQALAALKRIHDAVAPLAVGRADEDLRAADYAAVRQAGYPAYLGGPSAFRSAKWS